MTGKKIRNIWPVGGRASRSSRGIIVHRVCVCAYTRSRTGAYVSLTRNNGEDTIGEGEGSDRGLVYSYSHVRQKRPPFLLSLYIYIFSSLLNLHSQSSSSVPVIVSVQLVVIKYDLIKRTIVENTYIQVRVCVRVCVYIHIVRE